MFAGFPNTIAADDRLALSIAIHRTRRLALFARRCVDTTIATRRRSARSAIAYAARTCGTISSVHSSGTLFAELPTDRDIAAGFTSIARIHIAAIGIGVAREFAIGFATGVGTIGCAKIAFLAHFEGSIAANGVWRLASSILATIRRNASRVDIDVVRHANRSGITSIGLTNGCGRTIGRGIDTRKRTIRVTSIAIDQIAIVANFRAFDDFIATNRRSTCAIFANSPRCARGPIGKRTATRVRRIITTRRDTRIEIRTITGWISR